MTTYTDFNAPPRAIYLIENDDDRMPDDMIQSVILRRAQLLPGPHISLDTSGSDISISAVLQRSVRTGELSTVQDGSNPNYLFTDIPPVLGTMSGKTFSHDGRDFTIRQIEFTGGDRELSVGISADAAIGAETFNDYEIRLPSSDSVATDFRFENATSVADSFGEDAGRTFTWIMADFWADAITNGSWGIYEDVTGTSYLPPRPATDSDVTYNWLLGIQGASQNPFYIRVPVVAAWAEAANTDVIPVSKLGLTAAQFRKILADLQYIIPAGEYLYEGATANAVSAVAYTAANIAGLTYGNSYMSGPRQENVFAAVRLPLRAKDRLSTYRMVVGEIDGSRVFHAYNSDVWTHITDTANHAYYIVFITDNPSGDSVFVQRLNEAKFDDDLLDFSNIIAEANADDTRVEFGRATADAPTLDAAFPPAQYAPGDVATFITSSEEYIFAILVDGVPEEQANADRNRLTYNWTADDGNTVLDQSGIVIGNPGILIDEGGYLARGSGEGDVVLVFDQNEYNTALGIADGTEMPERLYARISADSDAALQTVVGSAVYDFTQGAEDTEDDGHVSWVYSARFPTNAFQPALYPVAGLKFGLDFYSDSSLSMPLNFLPAVSIIPDTDGNRWQIVASSDDHSPYNSSLKNREQSSLYVRNIGADEVSAFMPLGINLVDEPAGIIETQITLGGGPETARVMGTARRRLCLLYTSPSPRD